MRRWAAWTGVFVLCVAGCGPKVAEEGADFSPAPAPDKGQQTQALAQVLRAIEAHGGQTGFGQLQRCRLKSEITVFGDGGSRKLIWEDVFEAPDALRRRVLDAESSELLRESLLTPAGHLGREPGGEVTELPPVSVESMLPTGVGMLRMLRRAQQPEAQLAAPGGSAVSILLPDEPEYTLSFDPQSHLLSRARQSDRANAAATNSSALEIELGEVRDWGSLKIPGKATASRGGKKLFELNLLEFEPLERIESGTFRGLE